MLAEDFHHAAVDPLTESGGNKRRCNSGSDAAAASAVDARANEDTVQWQWWRRYGVATAANRQCGTVFNMIGLHRSA